MTRDPHPRADALRAMRVARFGKSSALDQLRKEMARTAARMEAKAEAAGQKRRAARQKAKTNT